MGKIVGIDLGTSRSVIAYIDDLGSPTVISNAEGSKLTPSVVLFDKEDGEIVVKVGQRAKNAAIARPEDVVRAVKRYMRDEDWVFIDSNDSEWRPETISSFILKKLKKDAEIYLKEEITQAVISVPYYFGNTERERTKIAGELAGLEVMQIINEPVAAAIAYGLTKKNEPMKCLIYDLGGGTFDIAVVEVNEKAEIAIKATYGDSDLGGANFDEKIVNYFAEEFNKAHGVDPLRNLRTYQEFLDRAEKAKEDLSFDKEVYVGLTAEGKVLDVRLTRDILQNLISADINDKIKGYMHETLIAYKVKRENLSEEENNRLEKLKEEVKNEGCEDGKKEEWEKFRKDEWGKIDKILLVGGSTRMPLVREMIKNETGKDPEFAGNPDEVVALGAASFAAWKNNEIVRRPDGLPIPAASITTIVSHSLGVKAIDIVSNSYINSKIIKKGEKLPASGVQKFTTINDNATDVQIVLLQGEEDNPEFSRVVGSKEGYIFSGIPPMLKGVPDIEIKMEYDLEDIVHVTAKELKSGIELEFQADVNWLDDNELEKEKEKVEGITVK